jgi:hydroxypyruvate isomerase
MKRKQFIRQSALAGAAALGTSSGLARTMNAPQAFSDQPFKLNYAIHEGMFKFHAGENFLDQLQFAFERGFRAMEDNGMMDRTAEMQEKIGKAMARLGMTMGVFVLNFDHWPVKTSLCSGDPEWREKFLQSCREAVEVAKRCQAKWITVVPGNYDSRLPLGYQTAHVIETLRRGAEIFEPHQLVMVLEPLSDTPDLFLRHPDQAFMICRAVKSPSCKILYDMYHMQRNEGNIIPNLDAAYEEINYFQIGDNPGRKEPGTGEMNYRNIFKHLFEKGYKGVLGMEHGLSLGGKEGELALIQSYRDSDHFS